MFKNLKTYFKLGRKVIGLELINDHGKDVYNLLLVSQKKDELVVEQESIKDNAIQSTLEKYKGFPIHFTLNESNVLSKLLDTRAQTDEISYLNQAFPKLDRSAFFYQITQKENKTLVSICRKKKLEAILETFKTYGLKVYALSFGVHEFFNFTSYFKGQEVLVNHLQLQINLEGDLEGMNNDHDDFKEYDFNGIKTNNFLINPLSGALSLYFDQESSLTNLNSIVSDYQSNFFQKRLFKLITYGSLIFLLVALLINFIFFNHYFKTYGALQENVNSNKDKHVRFTSLQDDIKRKTKVIDNIQKNRSSTSIYYLNEVIKLMPESVALDRFSFQPLTKKIQKDKALSIELSTLVVSGKMKSSDEFSEWHKSILTKKFVDNIEIIDFEKFEKKDLSSFSFKILIEDDSKE